MANKAKIEVLLTANEIALVAALRRGQTGLTSFGKTAVQEAKKAESSLSRLSSIKLPLAGVFGGAAVAYYANEVRKVADEYTNLDSRIKLVTSSHDEFVQVRERLYEISQKTGTEYAGNADSFSKLHRAMRELGAGSKETLDLTEMVTKALVVNGSTTEMSSSFMLQFGQAMGSGVLQGEEFRAMMEANSFFGMELAKALDVDIAGLRQMSKDGELTAAKLREAFPKMAQAISGEFEKIAPTTQRAMTMLENAYKKIVDDSNKASGGTGKVSQSIIDLATTIDQRREGIISLFSFLIDMAAGAADKVIRLTTTIGNIGQSFTGWDAVFDGKLSFFEFATMNAEELNDWLKKNVEAAKATATAVDRSNKEIEASASASAASQKKITGDALKEMEKKYKDYARDVKKIQDDLADHQRSAQEELRDMQRSGMSDLGAWEDRKREAGEFAQKAKEAAAAAKNLFASGNVEGGRETYKVAVQYADKAKAAYKDLNNEIKSGDQVVIDQKTALQAAMTGMQEANKIKTDILQQQSTALQAAQAALNEQSGGQLDKSIEQAKTKVGELGAAADEAKAKVEAIFNIEPPADGDWGKVWEAMESGSSKAGENVNTTWDRVWDQFLASGSEDIAELESKLQELSKDRHIKVYVEEVSRHATGGLVQRLARGGRLPGYGGGDRISALLEAGEYVIRKEAVSKFGSGLFHALNSLRLPEIPRFASGGAVGASPSEIHALDISLGGSYAGRLTGSPVDVRAISKAFAKADRLRSK